MYMANNYVFSPSPWQLEYDRQPRRRVADAIDLDPKVSNNTTIKREYEPRQRVGGKPRSSSIIVFGDVTLRKEKETKREIKVNELGRGDQ